MNWKATNQKNKAVVWDYWQRMNNAEPSEVKGICEKVFHKSVDWNGSQPFNQIRGIDDLIVKFWEPLQSAFPDIERVPYILLGGMSGTEEWASGLGGMSGTEEWVSGYGYLTGTFVHDWLGIPATGKKTNINKY